MCNILVTISVRDMVVYSLSVQSRKQEEEDKLAEVMEGKFFVLAPMMSYYHLYSNVNLIRDNSSGLQHNLVRKEA